MSRLSSRLIVSAAAFGVVAALAASPADAGTAGRAPALISTGAQSPHASPLVNSRYLAGYRATDPDHVSGVIIKAVDVPDVTCSGRHFEGVALGGGSEPAIGQVEYFAGVYATCVSGQPQYLMEAIVGGEEQTTGIEPGDQAQIVITVHCDAYPTCEIFSSATSLDTATDVSVDTTIDLTTDSAVFGAFPLFGEHGTRPAPVPSFGRARIIGCLFDNHLLSAGAQRLTRSRHGDVEISATKIHVGSFKLKSAT